MLNSNHQFNIDRCWLLFNIYRWWLLFNIYRWWLLFNIYRWWFLFNIYRRWLLLMTSTLIPIPKDKLGDAPSSENYRSIAISSIVLKIFDWVVLLLFEKELSTDELQFGFQQNTSANMCTSLVVETIDYFQRNGSEVYACVMDLSKAFDRIKHSALFWKLLKKGMPPVYVRLLLVMYEKQNANVRWNNVLSETFSMNNGVKQGAVLSPILFCVYIDSLFTVLRRNRTGCWINGMYAGIMGYADDMWLLSPTQDGLQEMVQMCSYYCKNLNLSFSTHPDPRRSKTKCIAYTKKEKTLRKIGLDGCELPWVDHAKHLGHKITFKINGLSEDLMEKRAHYINRVNELNQEFYFANHSTKIKVSNIFNTSFYGSQIWDLFSDEAIRLEKSWNISIRILLGIPRNTHRYFIEPLSGTPHMMLSLYTRFLNFINSIKNSSKGIL